MKLIKCHVENFGTLHDFDMEFDEGLSVIKEDNGFGKTTAATFIKAMFYGFPETRKTKINENERRKYDPWQGGNFGGSLDFECDKGAYRIERFFGAKAKDDTFRLFDLAKGEASGDFTESVGDELFGIDAESFERSIFMPQQRLDSGLNASLNAKLTGLVENSDDIGNFDSAMAELKKQQSARGVKGRLDAVEKEILSLERQINERRAFAEALPALEAQRKAYKQEAETLVRELDGLRKSIRAASDIAAAVKDNDRRKELLAEAERHNNTVRVISQKYPSGLPTETEVTHIAAIAESYNSSTEGIKLLEADTAETERMQNAEAFFKNGVPDAGQLASCRENIRNSQTARAKAEAYKARISALPDSAPKSGKGLQTALLAAALLLAVGGIGLLFISTALGVVLLAVGIVLAGVSGFMMLKGMIASASAASATDTEELKAQYQAFLSESRLLEKQARDLTSLYCDGEPQSAVDIIAAKLSEYENLKTAAEARDRKKAAEKEKIDALYSELDSFFTGVSGSVPGNFSIAVAQLREDLREFKNAAENLKLCEEKLKAVPEREVPEGAETADREELIGKEAQMGKRLDFVRRELTSTESRIASAEVQADALQELASQLEEKQAESAELGKMLAVVGKTAELLSTARDNLSSRYMQVMKDGFKNYASEILGDDIGDFLLDNSLELNLQRQGGAREKDYFSEGFRDMLDICMRLALIDALYDGERPMLILDDPFVNLDDTKVDRALEMLGKLAAKRQILYLTCHSGRMPK